MTTESSASNSACGNIDACSYRGVSSIASRLKVKKLTTAKTQQTVNLPVHASSPSEYATSDSHTGGGKLFNKRKRVATNVSERSDSHRNDGRPPIVTSAKGKRLRSSKCQSTEATRGTAKRNTHKKGVESEVGLTTEIDASSSDHLQFSCPAGQSCNKSSSFAPEALGDDNTSSGSDVEWEDVEGRGFF